MAAANQSSERRAFLPAGLDRKALPPLDFAHRLANLREAVERAGCSALLVSSLPNVRYLSGFSGSAGMVFVRPDDAVLITDGRYATSAAAEVAGAPVSLEALPAAKQSELLADLVAGLARALGRARRTGQAGQATGTAGAGRAGVPKRPRLGLEAEHVSWEKVRRWQEGWASMAELVPIVGLVEAFRRRKGAGELTRLAAAAAVADEALARALPLLAGPELSEVELALALEAEMCRLGAEAPAFPTIVASGPAGAEPHHHPDGRAIKAGDLVTVDFGASVDGYCSDTTRTVRAGDDDFVPDELRRLVSVVLASQDAGLSAVAAGVAASEVDRACREVVEAAGMGELFVHGTGHGVGLEVHEAPALSKTSNDVLQEGDVVTVEPGIYVPGLGGARTEDTVVVLQGGCEVLTLAPKWAATARGRLRRHRTQGGEVGPAR
jgi:Xaa-Pro aminopeptidase